MIATREGSRLHKRLCCGLRQALEKGTAETAGMGEHFAAQTGHLSAAHADFLAHWLRLVDLEEGDLSRRRSEFWALPGALQGFRVKAQGSETTVAACAPQHASPMGGVCAHI
jgi:hypothetical protein